MTQSNLDEKISIRAYSGSETSEAEGDAGHSLLDGLLARIGSPVRRAEGIALGRFDGFAPDGVPLVTIAALGLSGIAARAMAPLDADRIGDEVALGFVGCDPLQPLILGFMLLPRAVPEVIIDGEHVLLNGERTVEMRCGEAAIILSADGRIDLRGTYITSHASATQRILGGSVIVN